MLELMAQAEKQNKYGEPDNFRNEMPSLDAGSVAVDPGMGALEPPHFQK
jgi:hypothetical protein